MSLLHQMEQLKHDVAVSTLDSRIELYGVTGRIYLPTHSDYTEVYNNYDDNSDIEVGDDYIECKLILLGDVYGKYILSENDIPIFGEIFAIFESGVEVQPDSVLRLLRNNDDTVDYKIELSKDEGVVNSIIPRYKLVYLED